MLSESQIYFLHYGRHVLWVYLQMTVCTKQVLCVFSHVFIVVLFVSLLLHHPTGQKLSTFSVIVVFSELTEDRKKKKTLAQTC